MESTTKEAVKIKGWGEDADPRNDPTYPMKHRTEAEVKNTWQRPPLQPETIEILHSIERPNLTAVFGTSAPPKGLSGVIRRIAFKYSENSFRHWIPLLIADRVDVVKGVINDLSKGKFPNFFLEKGGKARWKYDKKRLFTNIAIGIILTSGALSLVLGKNVKKVISDI